MVSGRCVVVLATLAVLAQPSRSEGLDRLPRVLKITELVIPDLRLEVASDEKRLVISVPVSYRVASPRISGRLGLTLVGFVEPQLRVTGDTSVRGLAGGRLYVHRKHLLPDEWVDLGLGYAPLVEAGGVVGQDGSGGFVGAGLSLGDPVFGVTLAVVGRVVATTEENRWDVALDFQIPFNVE